MIKLYLEAGGPLTISFQATSWPNVKPSLGVLLSRPPGQGTGGLIEWNLRSNCVELELNSNSQIKGIGETTMFPFPGDRGVDWMKSQIKLDWYWIELPIIMNSFQFEWKSRSWNIPFFQNDTVWPIYATYNLQPHHTHLNPSQVLTRVWQHPLLNTNYSLLNFLPFLFNQMRALTFLSDNWYCPGPRAPCLDVSFRSFSHLMINILVADRLTWHVTQLEVIIIEWWNVIIYY